jgi:predicted deacetylase
MNVTSDEAVRLVDKGLGEFEKAGLKKPKYFAPPAWITSPQSTWVLEDKFKYVYYADSIKGPDGRNEFISHEYTWYDSYTNSSLEKAKADFLEVPQVFRLTVHLGAVNSPENIGFLEDFLQWIENGGA